MDGELSPLDALSDAQKSAFSDLKSICEKNGSQWPNSELDEQSPRDSHDDVALL